MRAFLLTALALAAVSCAPDDVSPSPDVESADALGCCLDRTSLRNVWTEIDLSFQECDEYNEAVDSEVLNEAGDAAADDIFEPEGLVMFSLSC